MMYGTEYDTGLIGSLTLASDGEGLVGCWFEHDRFFGQGVRGEALEPMDDLPVFDRARDWLDRYFAGERVSPAGLPLAPRGSDFQLRVWDLLTEIPYGETVTYGQLAQRMAAASGKGASARAVGGAVGRNPLCVIVPCHRVVGAGGNLTGFGGGIATKVKLLELERVDMSGLYVPKTGTAL